MATNVKTAAVKTAAKSAPKAVKPAVEVEKVAVKKAATKTQKTTTAQADATRNRRKVLRGVVISNKMEKTGVVEITRKVPHPLYKKVVTKTSRFKFHDEKNECEIGDTIEVMETRPLSKDKYFRLVRIVEKVK
ncbi:MAG: 30S ribosomal protein S17 [Clostridia bacterium]|nr:30S ribosomal protein S17 [Clostridia bacterium]